MGDMQRCPACGTVYIGHVCPACQGATPPTPAAPAGPVASGGTFRGLEIVEPLGRGGMGVVYKARQPGLNRLVAVKLLAPDKAKREDLESRFGREARALAALSHPNIVGVYDFGSGPEGFHLVMEYVDGSNLREHLRARRLASEEAVRIAMQVCEALEYAHGEGIVHRDIKPENILLDKKGRVKLVDFGLAKLVDSEAKTALLTQSGMMVGTAAYMSPEQMDSARTVDHRTDLYSLGVVLYEMLAGERPMGTFAPPSKKADVPPGLDAVVRRALEPDPKDRFASAAEFRSALLEHASTVAAPPKPAASRSLRKLIVGFVALDALIAAAVLIRFSSRPPPTTPAPPPTEEPDEKRIAALLPDAAAIDPALWTKLKAGSAPPPDEVSDHSLTYALFVQPAPRDMSEVSPLEAAPIVERPGRVSILQPEHLSRVTFDPVRGTGRCEFRAGRISGAVEFGAVREKGGWTITEFLLPAGGQKLVRQNDGRWRCPSPERFSAPAADVEYELLRSIPTTTDSVLTVAFSSDGKWLASGGIVGPVSLRPLPEGEERSLFVQASVVLAIAGPPTANLLAAATMADDGSAIYSWDPSKTAPPKKWPLDTPILTLAFSPTGKELAALASTRILRWRVSDAEELPTLEGVTEPMLCLAYEPTGKFLVTGSYDGSVRIWSLQKAREYKAMTGPVGRVYAIACSPDGKRYVSGGEDRTIRIWNSEGVEVRKIAAHDLAVKTLAVHPQGRIVASGSYDRAVKLWDADSGALLQTLPGHPDEVYQVAFSPDGRLLASCGRGHALKLWVRKK